MSTFSAQTVLAMLRKTRYSWTPVEIMQKYWPTIPHNIVFQDLLAKGLIEKHPTEEKYKLSSAGEDHCNEVDRRYGAYVSHWHWIAVIALIAVGFFALAQVI